MLQAIRSKASSFVVKILFGILILTFGLWGIGDIFRDRGTTTTVATVGDRKIEAQELSREVRREAEQLRAALHGANLDTEQLKQFGIVDSSLQRLISRDLTALEVKRLRLAVGDEVVRNAILANHAFYNEAGQFDRNLYKQLLASNHMSEEQYEAAVRSDLVRAQLDGAVADGIVPPTELVDTLYRLRAERRVAEIARLPASAVPAPGTPTDAQIADFYKKHQNDFRVPELRSFTLGLLTIDDIAATIKVPDSKLHEEYQNRLAEFQTPEQRHLEQILVPDEAKAKQAAAELAAGKDFATVAKDVAGETADTLDIGFFKKEDLPPKLGDAAFALKQGQTTAPIQDTLGWHILRVTEIKPQETQPFDAVKDKLATEVARDKAAADIANDANKIDDALAGGASFADVAQRFGLKQRKIENVDAKGKDLDGKDVDLPQGGSGIVATAFATDQGQASQLNDLGENGYYVLQVDKVTPPSVRPLDQVRDKLISLWQGDQRDAALEALAKQIGDQANGKSLVDIAKARKLDSFTSEPLQRSGAGAKVPPNLVAKIFATKAGQTVFAKTDDGYMLAQVKQIMPGDPAKDTEAVKRLAEQLTPAMQEGLLHEYDQALRNLHPVTIDQAALDRAL